MYPKDRSSEIKMVNYRSNKIIHQIKVAPMEELIQLRKSIEKHDFVAALQIADELEEMSVEDQGSSYFLVGLFKVKRAHYFV